MSCGAGDTNPYHPGGFYQFGNTISRLDALSVISQFCATQAARKALTGPRGYRSPEPGWSTFDAVKEIVGI